MKLSTKQQHVLDLMRHGWELRFYRGYESTAHLQNRGGVTETVHLNTFFSLRDRNLIQVARVQYPANIYKVKP